MLNQFLLKNHAYVFPALFGLFLLSACGGGSSTPAPPVDAEPLTLPDHIDLSQVDEGTGLSQFCEEAGFDDPGTDYTNEPKMSWVDDTDALKMINDILGAMKDSGYENFVNRGPYKALVKQVGESDQSQGGSSSTSTNTESLMEMTLEVSRWSNLSPMIIKIWVHEDDGPGGCSMLVKGYFEVFQGVSAEYPYGVLEAHFMGLKLDQNGNIVPGDPLFNMAMQISAEAGNVIVQFLDMGEEDVGPFTYQWDKRANIKANDELTAGNAFVYAGETNDGTGLFEEETFYFAFNENYFKYQKEGEVNVEVEDKNDLDHKVYRYKLFDKDTGDAVVRNSGFPIRLPGGEYAYIGYWGLWKPHGASVSHGDMVTRVDTNETYTLVNVRGKLTKHTKEQIVLSELTDVEISVWDDGDDIIVIWDGISSFQKIGIRDHQTGQVTYITPEVYTFDNEWEGGWCEALSAWLCLGGLTPDNADTVNYHVEQTVNPTTAVNMFLYFWGFALDAPITQIDIDNAAANQSAYFAGSPVEKTYYFDALNLLLKEDDAFGDAMILGAELNLSGTEYEWGYWMSPLTEDGSYDEFTCWQIYEDDVYYSWSSGPHDWNQFSTVKTAGGQYVAFDAPLRLNYTHATANDINGDATHDGKKYSLEYDGFDMHIPWYFDDVEDEWVPVFNLKDGTVMQDANNPTVEYVVKGVEEELVMNEVTDPATLTLLETTLPIDTSIEPPTLTYKAEKTGQVGNEPVGAVLKVIKGELITE